MRRLKTEVTIIGSGSAAMLAAARLLSQGVRVVLINPDVHFGIEDLRPHHGLGLWNAAYRSDDDKASLADLYDVLLERMREIFPATVDHSRLTHGESWSILSTTPVHRAITQELEREFFRVEKRPWSSGHFRLVNPENVLVRTRRLGIDLPTVAQLEGAVIRNYALWWDAAQMGMYLCQYVRNRFLTQQSDDHCFVNARIEGRYGRKVVIATNDGDEVSIDSEHLYIFLTGELLPHIKSIVAACDEPWIQGTRKRRREQHFVWFEKPREFHLKGLKGSKANDDEIWMELGGTRYRWNGSGGTATWTTGRGPDGLERVVDEGLRLQTIPRSVTRFTQAQRAFRLEWEWKNPQWRETSHNAYWATSFEGDLWNIMEVLWNLPHH